MEIYFKVTSKLGRVIRITKDYWNKILSKHPLVAGLEAEIKDTLRKPIEVRISQKDSSVYLYYSKFRTYYLCVVVRHLNDEGYIITTYITDNIKIGRTVWKK